MWIISASCWLFKKKFIHLFHRRLLTKVMMQRLGRKKEGKKQKGRKERMGPSTCRNKTTHCHVAD